jgi:hypothetical protein
MKLKLTGYFFNFKKYPRETITQSAKIRPIWSPWRKLIVRFNQRNAFSSENAQLASNTSMPKK